MAIRLSDHEIQAYIWEHKLLPADWRKRIHRRSKPGHKEGKLKVRDDAGSEFRIIWRQSILNPLNFSIIFAVRPLNTTQLFRLRRYNGKSHTHTNRIEKDQFTISIFI